MARKLTIKMKFSLGVDNFKLPTNIINQARFYDPWLEVRPKEKSNAPITHPSQSSILNGTIVQAQLVGTTGRL